MLRMNSKWARQLVAIYEAGQKSREQGESRSANPYQDGHRNSNGPGGNLQRQRRQAWYDGWDRVNIERTMRDPTGMRS